MPLVKTSQNNKVVTTHAGIYRGKVYTVTSIALVRRALEEVRLFSFA